ncbi:MAG: PAS domain-containing protein [Oligoflexia bacterium]|nr:PAS domain-containing protein [Oligoflexia bacterium]
MGKEKDPKLEQALAEIASLKEANNFLKSIQDNASHAIISTTKKGIITSFNKQAEKMLGYKADELINKSSPAIFHDLDEVVARTEKFNEKLGLKMEPGFKTFVCHCDKGLKNEFEWIYVHKDGTKFPVLLSITQIIDEAGVVTGYLGIARDISEKIKLQEEVVRKNDQLEQAQSLSKVGSWSFDVLSGEISWSNEMYNIFPERIEDGEPAFEKHRSTIHPEDVEYWEGVVGQCIADGKEYKMTFRTHRLGDEHSTVWVEARGRGTVVDGKVVKLSGTCQDITEAVIKEKELSVILENNSIGTWRFNPITSELFWDQGMYDLFGIKKGDGIEVYETWLNTLHPDWLEKAQKDFEDALKSDGNFESSFKIITKDGEVKDIGARAIIDRDKDRNPVYVTGVNWDRTKEQTVLDELKKAERIKSEFLANMSHEIRTPMNGIIGVLELLNETDLSEKQKEMLDIVLGSSQTLLTILSDILDISKIEAGKLNIENNDFDVVHLLKSVTKLMESKAAENKTSLTLKKGCQERESFWVKGDEMRIRQILTNFISNAVKFTKNGEIEVGCELLEEEGEKKTLLFSVKDNGIGIDQKDQEKLFEAFVQADSSITRKFGGTGLGLTISSYLAKIMGGKVFFQSKKNVGSTFFFKVELVASSQTQEEVNSREIEDIDISSFKILLVEDNKVNQKVAKMMLKKLGYECDAIDDGSKALSQIKEKGVDYYSLILMDMQMPVMDGLTATKELIKEWGEEAPPIIALTANAFDTDKEECFKAGMVDYLSKPIKKDILKETLLRFVQLELKKSS